MSQVNRFFNLPQREDGSPELSLPQVKIPTARELFRTQCFLNGIYDSATVEELWTANEKRLRERRAHHASELKKRRILRRTRGRKRPNGNPTG